MRFINAIVTKKILVYRNPGYDYSSAGILIFFCSFGIKPIFYPFGPGTSICFSFCCNWELRNAKL